MSGYSKLFSSLVHSTIWRDLDHRRLMWITMLALKNSQGVVEASVPGLADAARVTLEQALDALERFQSPDKWSRNKTDEGRRIREIEGGWRVVNHEYYKRLESAEDRREKDAERKRVSRASAPRPHASANVPKVLNVGDPDQIQIRSDPDVERDAPPSRFPAPSVEELEATTRAEPHFAKTAPADFEPNDSHRMRLAELKLDPGATLRAFKLQEFNRKYSDWPRRFSKWIEDERVKRETEAAKALAAPASGASPGRFGPPESPSAGWSPEQRHRAFCDKHRLDLEALTRAYRRSLHGKPPQDGPTLDKGFGKYLVEASRKLEAPA